MPAEQWTTFFRDRGLDARSVSLSRLAGGEVNDNWRVDGAGQWVLRHYQYTADARELDCELAAVDRLARNGFPTPAPVPGPDRLWDEVDGRPAALFTFVPGHHPVERPGGYGSMDLATGVRSARLAAQMHLTLMGAELPGRRAAERDPWRRIGAFLESDIAGDPVFADLLNPLRQVHTRLTPLYDNPKGVPIGLIHNDITPLNVLLDDSGEIAALLDFDDSAQTFLAYELGSIIGAFGQDEERRVDFRRVEQLISGYESIRPFTPRERSVVPDLLIAHAGATGVQVISHWLHTGRADVNAMDSYSAQEFLDLTAAEFGGASPLVPRSMGTC